MALCLPASGAVSNECVLLTSHSVYSNLWEQSAHRTQLFFTKISSLITVNVVKHSKWIGKRGLWDLKSKINWVSLQLSLLSGTSRAFYKIFPLEYGPKAPFPQLIQFQVVLDVSIINTAIEFLGPPQTKREEEDGVGTPFMQVLSIA